MCRNGEQCSSNNDVRPLHVGKKLCNLLFLAIKVVFWGKYMASKNHILLVFENFNIDQHGLLKENINVKDKKKILVVQCIAFPKVRECFESIGEGTIYEGKTIQEHVKGTILHFEVIWAFLEALYGQITLL